MKDYSVTITFTGSLSAANEEKAQERAELIEAALWKGLPTLKAEWAPDMEAETEVEED